MDKFTREESRIFLQNQGIDISGQSLVFYAQEGSLTYVRHLINVSIDPKDKSREGLLSLHQASKNGHLEVVKYLLDNGAEVDQLDGDKLNAITLAVANEHLAIVNELISRGANVNGSRGNSCTPISRAAKNGDIYQVLLKNGADEESRLEIKKKENTSRGFLNILRNAYSPNSYIFLAVNLFCFFVIFFVLDKNTGGSLFMRIFVFSFCSLVGGFLGVLWSVRRAGSALDWYKYGAGIFLVIFTLLIWPGNGHYDENGQYVPSKSDSSSITGSCVVCGDSLSNGGWTIKEGVPSWSSSIEDAAYCSKRCAAQLAQIIEASVYFFYLKLPKSSEFFHAILKEQYLDL